MSKTLAAVAVIALFGLGLPAPALAATFTYVCEPAREPAPPDWFGGPYTTPVRLVIDTPARTVELLDGNNKAMGDTMPPARLAGLNNYKLDITVTEGTISWGIVEMWGFSGYIDRRTGRLDAIWTNAGGFSANTLTRQFHGTCKEH